MKSINFFKYFFFLLLDDILKTIEKNFPSLFLTYFKWNKKINKFYVVSYEIIQNYDNLVNQYR